METENTLQENRLLIVDDEASTTLLLKKLLEREGYRVDTANSALTALMLTERSKYHIVISDILMPDMDGLDLLQELRKRDPLIQVVIMTAGVTMNRAISALEHGATDFILKPIEPEELVIVTRLCEAKLKRWKGLLRAAFHQKKKESF